MCGTVVPAPTPEPVPKPLYCNWCGHDEGDATCLCPCHRGANRPVVSGEPDGEVPPKWQGICADPNCGCKSEKPPSASEERLKQAGMEALVLDIVTACAGWEDPLVVPLVRKRIAEALRAAESALASKKEAFEASERLRHEGSERETRWAQRFNEVRQEREKLAEALEKISAYAARDGGGFFARQVIAMAEDALAALAPPSREAEKENQ